MRHFYPSIHPSSAHQKGLEVIAAIGLDTSILKNGNSEMLQQLMQFELLTDSRTSRRNVQS